MDNGASSYRRFLDGDDSGFVEIIRDYNEGLTFYLFGIVGDLNLAQDLTEDTFVRIITKKPKFSAKSMFKTWLYAIGRNVAKDYIRRISKVTQVSVDECADLSDMDLSPLDAYIKEEQKRELHCALAKLCTDYRQALWLVYFEEMSLKDVAQVMGRSQHACETLLYRARKSLKAELEKEGFVYERL